MSISGLHDNEKSANIHVFRKHYEYNISSRKNWSAGGRSNLKLTHFPINYQDPSKLTKIFELKVHFKKYVYDKCNSTVRVLK